MWFNTDGKTHTKREKKSLLPSPLHALGYTIRRGPDPIDRREFKERRLYANRGGDWMVPLGKVSLWQVVGVSEYDGQAVEDAERVGMQAQ